MTDNFSDLCSVTDVSVFGVQPLGISSPERLDGEDVDDEELSYLLDQLTAKPKPTSRTMWD